jgi:mannose-6-phosphate isomerase-like protein (cupin superfamily)
MPNYTAKKISEMEAAFGGGFVKARAELGITSFGVQVIRLPPDNSDYPEHDHAADGQEEIYVTLAGSGRLEMDGESVDMSTDTLVRVGAGVMRKVHSGPSGIQMLVVGGCPGEAYKIPEVTELTAS